MKTKKIIVLLSVLTGLINPSFSYAETRDDSAKAPWPELFTPSISVLGYYFNTDYSGGYKTRQFNAAVNLEGEAMVRNNIAIGYNLQGAPGKDDIKLKDSASVVITDIYMDFKELSGSHYGVVIGSFDTPFGDQVGVVSNNADTLRNPFLMNSLFFSALGGTAGTLNTLGVNFYRAGETWDMALSVSNGTDEEAVNTDGYFEYVADLGYNFKDIGRISGSYLMSDDRKNDADKTGLEADLTAYIIDLMVNLPPGKPGTSYIKGYLGQAEFGDKRPATKDGLDFWMIEGKYTFLDKFYAAARYSSWNPDDNNGNGAGMSVAMPSPGITSNRADNEGFTLLTDQKVTRTQLALGLLEEGELNIKLIYFMDNYAHNSAGNDTDTSGIIAAVNVAF